MLTINCTTISADVDTATVEIAKASSIGERKKGDLAVKVLTSRQQFIALRSDDHEGSSLWLDLMYAFACYAIDP